MNVIVINPPLVQLNAPYPSGAYLSAFFKSQGCDVRWFDLSIELFYSIFSKEGLKKLFSLTTSNALKMAASAEKNGDEATAFNLRRYCTSQKQWIQWIDFITSVLCDGKKSLSTREKEHQFLYSPFAPRGNRMDGYLSQLEREPGVDDLHFLCSYALADLADYITAVFDSEFSLIRYAEALTVDESSFSEIEARVDSPVMKEFYQPVLEKFLGNLDVLFPNNHQKILVCISIPFAGTFVPALYTAKYLKSLYHDTVLISFGGGFVNTELREAKEPALANYIDFISYDRGYGSYHELLTKGTELFEIVTKGTEQFVTEEASAKLTKGTEENETEKFGKKLTKGTEENERECTHIDITKGTEQIVTPLTSPISPFYKLRVFIKETQQTKIIEPLWKTASGETEQFETDVTVSLVPDYSDIDFSRYLRVCDDKNPMHRLWTDGAWIKAYLAHGCYWHKCAFCDVKLDYVCAYKPVNVEKLFDGLLQTAREKNIYGIHFVDEALPASYLKRFALLNARNGNPLYYWGNVRFEKSFSKDLAAFLSYCGFGGVSAGLEVATGTGLKNINKGTDIDSIVNACAAFKEAGILVHAYMIYGFWYDTPQSIMDSMETLRQFFAAGLLDSAFWHKFVLTRNSGVFDSLKDRVVEINPDSKKQTSMFARNNVHFNGEEKYNKFGQPLEAALEAWMHGQKLDMKIQKWFDFNVPSPTINRDFIDKAIEKYEMRNESRAIDFSKVNSQTDEQLFWIGSTPVVSGNNLYWIYLQEEQSISLKGFKNSSDLVNLFLSLKPEAEASQRQKALEQIKKSSDLQKLIQRLHYSGIVFC